mgnify:CR=1 FL=1
MIKFVLESYSFRRILVITAVFVLLLLLFSKVFDLLWKSNTTLPIITLGTIYSAPKEYDNFSRLNLKLINGSKVVIEGNKRLRLKDSPGNFEYFDTLNIEYPVNTFEKTNRIFLQFEDSPNMDSVYLVTSKSEDNKLFYKQIFYSSAIIEGLNYTSSDPVEFRIDPSKLVTNELLINNDTLINQVYDYFNNSIDTLGLAECGTNSIIFKRICDKFGLPCRIINLQGGDIDQVGYFENIGYPLHVVCEIYSSRFHKWYVIDPSFGFRFMHWQKNDYLNAVEICNIHTFRREDEIHQDSVLFTKRSLVGKDYFKYYENVVFTRDEWKNKFLRKLASVFYANFTYYLTVFSNNYPPVKNGFYYVGIKTFMYFFLFILYTNVSMLIIIKRLFEVKKPKTPKT